MAPFERQFIVAFFADTIRQLAMNAWDKADPDETALMDWDEWGPVNTRFLECRTPSQWICYTYASRLLLMRPDVHGPRISIFDFHPGRIVEFESQAAGYSKINRCFIHRVSPRVGSNVVLSDSKPVGAYATKSARDLERGYQNMASIYGGRESD